MLPHYACSAFWFNAGIAWELICWSLGFWSGYSTASALMMGAAPHEMSRATQPLRRPAR